AWPDDVVPTPLRDLDHRVARDGVDPAALGDQRKPELAVHWLAAGGELFALVYDNRHAFGAGAPSSGRVREALRLIGEPVQAGDGQETVLVGEQGLVLLVPLCPVLGE